MRVVIELGDYSSHYVYELVEAVRKVFKDFHVEVTWSPTSVTIVVRP